ncbi:MAG: YdcF family protein [Pyramidobacter sp.]|nr:YdcF family protein [Pyramidobacter sp.]
MTQAAYFFSTLLTALLSPLGLYLEAIVLTLTAPFPWLKKRRRCVALLLTLLFAFACTDFCGMTLLSSLERLSERLPGLNGQKSVVFVVLGGGAVAEGDTYQPSISSQRRLRRARKLAEERAGSTLMLSGIEAPVMARWLGDTPFLMEPHSLNTRSNIDESAKLLRRLYPDADVRPAVCIVTDRFHTPRAMSCARSLMADFEVCVSPAPSLVRRSPWRLFHFIPTGSGLAVTSMAWREMIALMRDWITARLGR